METHAVCRAFLKCVQCLRFNPYVKRHPNVARKLWFYAGSVSEEVVDMHQRGTRRSQRLKAGLAFASLCPCPCPVRVANDVQLSFGQRRSLLAFFRSENDRQDCSSLMSPNPARSGRRCSWRRLVNSLQSFLCPTSPSFFFFSYDLAKDSDCELGRASINP